MVSSFAIRIRKATLSDIRRIHRLRRLSIRKLSAHVYSRKQIEAWTVFVTPKMIRMSFDTGYKYFVALRGQRLVGFSTIQEGEIHALFVHPAYAKKGIGRQLIRHMESQAKRKGHKSISLNATRNAFPFYKRCGFRLIRKTTYTLDKSLKLPIYRMRKRIEPKNNSC